MTASAGNTARPKLVFFGSGPVAAKSLELLLEWCDVEAVITKPKPPHHREEFPVISVANSHDLPTHLVSNRRELDALVDATSFDSRVGVLIDFGIIVSRKTIDTFELGIINSHFSLLPEWRGADPITFSILSGQKQTGVSLMLLVEAMDEGPLIGHGEYDLPPDITTPQLTEELIQLSDALLQHTLPLWLAGEVTSAPQTVTGREVSYSRKLTKEDGVLDWTKPAARLEREVRAYAGWPKSRTVLAGKDVIITKAHAVPSNDPDKQPGDVEALLEGIIMIETADGYLCIDKLKPAGKSEMGARAFLAGNRL